MSGFWLTAFRALARLLPAEFREAWFAEAERDLQETLRERAARQGRIATWWAGLSATADLARRIPVEWWAARPGRRDGRGSLSEPERGAWIMEWLNDLKLATRTLARRPAYAGAAALTLSLGIGAAVAIFTVVNAVVLRPLPYPDADQVVFISHHAPGLGMNEVGNSPGTIHFYRQNAPFFAAIAGYQRTEHNMLGGTRPERVHVGAVEPSIFQVLLVQPALGRPFTAADAKPGAAPVAILTDATWRTRFGSRTDVLGRRLNLDGVVTEIVGVMPPDFVFPDDHSVVALVPFYVDPKGPFGSFGTSVVARLAPGVDLHGAQARASELQSRLPGAFPGQIQPSLLKQAKWSVTVVRLQDRIVGRDVARALWIVLATVGFLLLIAAANVANLFLVRADGRRKELAVRAALGAGSRRIAAGFLTEALVLGVVGGLVGLGLAWGGVQLLVAHGPTSLPRLHEVSLDGASLLVAAGLSVVASLAFGALPVLRYRASAVARTLRDGGRASTDGPERNRTRSALVAVQLSFALVLLVGSGLMLRTFDRLRAVNPGFDPDNVLTVGLSIGEQRSPREAATFYEHAADAVAALPGVEHVGLSGFVPLGQGSAGGSDFYVEGAPRSEGVVPPFSMYKAVGPGYAPSLGIRVIAGRGLTRADCEGDAAVAVVNEAFAKKFLGGEAVGKAVRWSGGADSTFLRIVGVYQDVRERSLRADVGPWGYVPLASSHLPIDTDNMYLIVRSRASLQPSATSIREAVASIDGDVPISSFMTMDEVMARAIAQTSFTMVLLGIAAGVALFLGAIGLFGVITYVVGQRTREIGVRVALGAARADIRSLVLHQSARVILTGLALGLGGAFALTRLMKSVLFEVTARDPVTFVGAPLLLLGVAVLATWLPARRASRVDPMQALRME